MKRASTALAAIAATSLSTAALAAEGQGGLPQLNANDFAPQLIWLAISFVLLLVIMSRVALPRIGDVLEERRDRVQRDLDAAQRFKGETEKALAAYEQSLAEARSNASGLARQAREALAKQVDSERSEVDKTLNAKLAQAEASIAASKSKALASVGEIAADSVSAIVDKLIGQTVPPDEINRALGSK
jgi:F-type H+-transporting ATPase subunit b